MKIGSYNLYSIETSEFRLDGGAMFGIIPKTMWRKFSPADELNRIHLVYFSHLLINIIDSSLFFIVGSHVHW